MEDISNWNESNLDQIVTADEKENTTLDYKDSNSLKFKDRSTVRGYGSLGEKHKKDLAADVASMANAEGGLIVYGIKERRGGYPDRVDDGVALADLEADTIERVIVSNINPRVQGFRIKPIPLVSKGNNTFAYVISVPKTKNGPHQTSDFLYHKRHGATTQPMSDNEIRDMVGRSLEFGRKFGIAWDLYVEVKRIYAAASSRKDIGNDHVKRTMLYISVSNSLRSSGVAIMELPKNLRQRAATLVNDLDQYNSIIEAADPGQREEARLTDRLREILGRIITNSGDISVGLTEILKDEPE